jgi:hypothetical protein
MRKDVRRIKIMGRATVGMRCGKDELVVVAPDWNDGRGREMNGVDCAARYIVEVRSRKTQILFMCQWD